LMVSLKYRSAPLARTGSALALSAARAWRAIDSGLGFLVATILAFPGG
jgi:hypothetical protein